MAKELTTRQALFVQEYLVDGNATQAATRAGYSPNTANEQGARLLANVSVAAAVEAAMIERAERTKITQDRVLRQYANLAFFDIRKLYREDGSLKPIHELDDETAAALAGVETSEITGPEGQNLGIVRKVKLTDRRAALADIAKHLGMFVERHKHEHSGKVDLAALINEARKRAG